MLAAHMNFDDPADVERVGRFWGAPRMAAKPGLKAVEMFDAVAEGRIKALWVMATNPAVSLPEADRVRRAMARDDVFVAVSDVMRRTDTTELADVLLPAAAWGEKDGAVTNSERRISRQRAFMPTPGEARPDWRVMSDVAAAMGWGEAFDYASPADVFREHARLSGFENEGRGRLFDISAKEALTDAEYDALEPFQWPASKHWTTEEGGRLFAQGGFPSADRKARMLPLAPTARGAPLTPERPFVLNTGRVRDHWHTMTRTAKSARLSQHIAEPYLEIHPEDAARLGLEPAVLARVQSDRGAVVLRVMVTERQRRGSVFAPMHWSAQNASAGRVDALVAPLTDPISGQPESKRTPVSVAPQPAAWHGFAVTRGEPQLDGLGYWAKARARTGWRVEFSDPRQIDDLRALAGKVLGFELGDGVETASYEDAKRGARRLAAFDGDRLLGALFLSPGPVAAARDWLAEILDGETADAQTRMRLLAGRGGADRPDEGRVICVCHMVGAKRIETAIDEGALSVDAIGTACAAGTGCGSCHSELKAMLSRRNEPIAAE